MTAAEIRVLIVDDHPVVRAGIDAMLAPEPDLVIVGEAADGAEAVSLASRLAPDVVLMDVRMPGLDGPSATERLRELPRAPAVIVLTMYDTDSDILRAIEAGAVGYLLKDAPRGHLIDAIREAASGGGALAPAVTARLLRQVRAEQESLTPRELDVLRLVALGYTNQQIGEQLYITAATVKTHLARLFAKLDVTDRTRAVTRAQELGLLVRS